MKIGESVRLGAMRKVIKGNFEEKKFCPRFKFFSSRDHWQDPVMLLLTGWYIRMYVACPLQNLDRGVRFGSALSPRMLGCCEVGPVGSWALSDASGWQAQLSV